MSYAGRPTSDVMFSLGEGMVFRRGNRQLPRSTLTSKPLKPHPAIFAHQRGRLIIGALLPADVHQSDHPRPRH